MVSARSRIFVLRTFCSAVSGLGELCGAAAGYWPLPDDAAAMLRDDEGGAGGTGAPASGIVPIPPIGEPGGAAVAGAPPGMIGVGTMPGGGGGGSEDAI